MKVLIYSEPIKGTPFSIPRYANLEPGFNNIFVESKKGKVNISVNGALQK
jgi:hypothetical protein